MAYRSPKTGRFISNAAWHRWYAPGQPLAQDEQDEQDTQFIDDDDGFEGQGEYWDDAYGNSEYEDEGWDDIAYFDYDEIDDFADEEADDYEEDGG